MQPNFIFGLDAPTLQVLTELAASIRLLAGSAGVPGTVAAPAADAGKTTKPADDAKADPKTDAAQIYWYDSTDKTYGIVEGAAAFTALKKAQPKVVKWTEEKYSKQVADDAKAAEAAADKGAEDGADKVYPTVEDLLAAFSQWLPADLPKPERAERAPFVKALMKRFGDASKVTEMKEQYRELAINLVLRKVAGEDVDPETAEFEAIEESEDDDLGM